MDWKFVESSNLRAFRYNKSSMSLDVQFKNGSTYRYNQVPMSIAKGMENADSVGSYFAESVKGTFNFEKLS